MTQSRFVWFEYVSTDAAKAQTFFGELFGWSTRPVPMPGGDYVMIAAPDGTTIGGYDGAPGDVRTASWLPYLLVDSASDAAAKIKKLGGKVIKEPFKVGDFATMAVVADPHGAGFAVWQPAKPEDPGKPAVGRFCWNELSSRDPAASVAFYSQIGGFTSTSMDMGEFGTYHVLASGSDSRAGIMALPMPEAPHQWTPYVQVASADQSAERARRLGATIVAPPTDIPNVGRFAIFVDPLGATLGILQP